MEELPAPDALQVTVAFDRKEHSAARFAASRYGPLLLRPIVRYPVAIVVGLGIFPLTQALGSLCHLALPLATKAFASVVLMAVVALGIRHSARQGEENKRHEQNPDAYTLNDAGLEISGVDDLALMSWSSMDRVHETDRFFLFVSGSEVQYLPKRVLDAAQEAQVRALVARHAPVAGRPRLRS
jgi:hypothetical protein